MEHNNQLKLNIIESVNINNILSNYYEEYNYKLSDYSLNSDKDNSDYDKIYFKIYLNSENNKKI